MHSIPKAALCGARSALGVNWIYYLFIGSFTLLLIVNLEIEFSYPINHCFRIWVQLVFWKTDFFFSVRKINPVTMQGAIASCSKGLACLLTKF